MIDPASGFIGDNFTAYIKEWDCIEDSCQYMLWSLNGGGGKDEMLTDGFVGEEIVVELTPSSARNYLFEI